MTGTTFAAPYSNTTPASRQGASRAAESMIAALLSRYFEKDGAEQVALMGMANHSMRNCAGCMSGRRLTNVPFDRGTIPLSGKGDGIGARRDAHGR
ncbi:hypothetical protein [Ciceribacter selenitireducens]|uniref:hypothetical protein n=1 Tax=Ciceribacter selenitireducens TaxID=448181 RepID=UPI00048D617A